VNRMSGTIPSPAARKILLDPRVQSVLLSPAGFKLPEDAQAPVKVHLELAGGLSLERQRVLADQLRPYLLELGFREAIGYDHRGHTRLVGTLPAERLGMLLQDLRWQSSGWLVPDVPVAQLPTPLRNGWPLRLSEVILEPVDVPPAKDTPPPSE